MADPYEWRDGQGDRARGYAPREEDARRAAERHAEQERSEGGLPPRGRGGDYGAGWYGEDAEREGYAIPGPYGRSSEQRDARRDDRHDDPGREHHRSLEAEAARVGRDLGRGWKRLSDGVRRTFAEERQGPDDRDFRREGGMFGGQDRRESLFSHDDGLSGRPLGGPHRGKGPRGYARPDARILDEVSDRLSDDGRLDASDIEVKVEAGEVTLNGHVSSRMDKRRAEDLAEQVSGVKHLQNNLRVRLPEQPAGQAQAADPARPPPPTEALPRPN